MKTQFRGFSVGYAGTAAVLFTVLLAGCGGDSGSSTGTSTSPPPPPTGGGSSLGGNGGLWAGTVSAPGTAYDGDSIVGVYTKSGE
ncbi:hypothetical protein ABTL73_20590, partial [Acinetobacter baumannii]